MADWFSSLASQAMKLADDFADSLVAQANEAQEQIQREQAKLREEDELKKVTFNSDTQLPWETQDEALQILSDALMDSILKLSLNERNFTVVPSNVDDIHFVFSDFVATALHLLKIDANLAHVHSKVSPKMDEEVFWRNYYGRVIYLRAACGIDGTVAQEDSARWKMQDMVFEPDYLQAKPTVTKASSSDNLQSTRSGGKQKSPPKRSPNSSLAAALAGTGDAELLGGLDDDDDDDDDLEEMSFAHGAAGSSGSAARGEAGSGAGEEEEGEGVEVGDEEEEEEEEEELDLADLDDELDLLRELREMEEDEEEEGGDADSGNGSGVQVSEQGKGKTADSKNKSKSKSSKSEDREVGELGSYEEVGKSDCASSSNISNAELEAQIAAELANISDDDD